MEQTSPVSASKHIAMLAQYELIKRVSHSSGFIALLAFTLIWCLILAYPVNYASSLITEPGFKEVIVGTFGEHSLSHLFSWEVTELAVFWLFALYLFPIFSIFISADQFSSDKHRGTLRFLLFRVSRSSLYFGRFLGQMLIQMALMAITLIVACVFVLFRDATLFIPAIITALVLLAQLVIVTFPYVAAMSLISLRANSARQASILAIVIWILLSILISLVAEYVPALEILDYLVPGVQLLSMANTNVFESFIYSPIPIIQGIVLLAAGQIVIKRSAL